jgi:1-acyl-sn-glycerol-3-phosphate acyltransferase
MAGDRFVERAITDEIMYELMQLSGRPYVDVYAAQVKAGGVAPPPASPAPSSIASRPPADIAA